MRTEQRYEDILKGYLVLISLILALFLSRTIGINSRHGETLSRGNLFVEIDGDIKYPGVYSFENKADARELIEPEGGIKSFPHGSRGLEDIRIHSGSKITIQRDNKDLKFIHEEMSPFHKITLGMPISINMESEEGLTAVPGIGPLLARSIVKKRTERGGFKTLEELKSVHGIGEKTYNKIIMYVTL